MLPKNKNRLIEPYIPIWNQKPSRGEAPEIASKKNEKPLPHIRIQLKDSKSVEKSVRNVLVPPKELHKGIYAGVLRMAHKVIEAGVVMCL